MGIDENDFFRRATMRICSSLDIETAMWRSIQFLKDFIPVDMMFLHLYESDLGAMRTNRNLEEMVKTKQFREDLWFRLHVFPIHVPPLRGRKEDIPALLGHFLEPNPGS